jgi:hypothetical protein
LVSSADHEAPLYVVFSIPLLPRHLFSSTPSSIRISPYVPPSMWETKFHTHTKQ